jgi:hypothetical protein
MKTLILTSVLIASLTTFSYSKPINEIYSIKEPVRTSQSYANTNPASAFEVVADTNAVKVPVETNSNDINYGSRTSDHHKQALKTGNTETSATSLAGTTDKEFESRLNEYYKNEPSEGSNSKNDFVISDEDQGSPFYVTVKLVTPSKAVTK